MKECWVRLLLAAVLLFTAAQPAAAGPKGIQVDLNGVALAFDAQPQMVQERVMVPFRGLAEALHVKVEWAAEQQIIRASLTDGTDMQLQVANTTAYIGGTPVLLDAAPVLINDRVLVPLRFFSEALGCRVDWLPDQQRVRVETPPAAMTVLGYYALGDRETSSWEDLFGQAYPEISAGNTHLVKTIALGWFSLDENGYLLTESRTGWTRPSGWEDVLAAAQSRGLKCHMTVHMVNGNGEITALLANEDAGQRAIREIVQEAGRYDGVNLDLEGLGLSEKGDELQRVRDRYTVFTQRLAESLHEQGKTLSLSLHAPNSSYHGYDYAAVGKYCDQIVVMAYDYGSVPEPLSLVEQAVRETLEQAPSGQVLLGISLPSETSASLPDKVEIARRYGLQGVALWRLGLVPDSVWQSLEERIAADPR